MASTSTGWPQSVTPLGKTEAQFKDARIWVAVSWRYAALHPGDRWTFFEVWVMPAGQKSLVLKREDISLVLPDGSHLGLPDQKTLTAALPDIRRVLDMGEISREHLGGIMRPRRRTLRFGFQEESSSLMTAFESRSLAPLDAGYGDLFFCHPGGRWAPGTYILVIKNDEVEARIPFELGTTQEK
jgi:hypothetical protein